MAFDRGDSQTGVTSTALLPIEQGGTNASTAAQARTNLEAAKSGANSDITALSGLTGNLTFSGTSNRITGDFSNATIANRVMFQSSTTNGATSISAIPNGTIGASGTASQFTVEDKDSIATGNGANGAFGLVQDSRVVISSNIRGTGTYLPMTFNTGGSERMRIDTSGNVGIGTSSPGARLDVNGTIVSRGDGIEGGQITINNKDNASQGLFIDVSATDNFGRVFSTNNNSVLNLGQLGGTGGRIGLFTEATERMRIDSSGNVGIGTSSPVSILEARTTGATVITAHSNSFTTAGNGTGFGVYRSVSGRLSGYSWTVASANTNGGGSGEYQLDAITFNTRATTTSGSLSEVMRIDSSGNVGIGTASPATTLDVNGQFRGRFTDVGTNTAAQALASNHVTQVTISADTTLTTTVPPAGTQAIVIIVSSGTVSRTVTFGTGFASTGTLATGTTANRRFVVSFVSDGTRMLECSRTAAITV